MVKATTSFPADLQARLVACEERHSCRIALALHDPLVPANSFSWRAKEPFLAASTMKVPVMMEVFRLAEQGRLDLSHRVTIDPLFRSIADHSPFVVEGARELQPRVGGEATLLELVEQMIVLSDNLATNLLLARTGTAPVTALIRSLGVEDCHVLRHLMDENAARLGIANTVTAEGLNRLMEAIATGRAASPSSCREMIRILLAQQYRDMIPAGIPPSVPVANKTGWEDDMAHDTAIVFAPAGNYYLTILSDHLPLHVKGNAFAPELSRIIWENCRPS